MTNDIYFSNYFSMIIQIILYGIKRRIKWMLFGYNSNNALANTNIYTIEFNCLFKLHYFF